MQRASVPRCDGPARTARLPNECSPLRPRRTASFALSHRGRAAWAEDMPGDGIVLSNRQVCFSFIRPNPVPSDQSTTFR
jgi:hypothetical protein